MCLYQCLPWSECQASASIIRTMMGHMPSKSLLMHPFAAMVPAGMNVTEAQAVLSPPQDCPGFSCVCRQQRSGARVAAPSDCTGFVTCDGRGSGNKTLCAVGLGFRAESSSCAPLSSSSSGGKRCVFATAGAQAIVPVVPPPPTKKPATAAAARPANLTAGEWCGVH